MLNTQKKALSTVSEILESYDSYNIESVLIEAMIEAGIDNKIRNQITDSVRIASRAENKKVCNAKSWIDALISDMK